MNITIINAVPTFRLIFLTQFLWGFSYFTFTSLIAPFLEIYLDISGIQALIFLWSFYIAGLVFSSIVGLMQDYWLGMKRSLYIGLFLTVLGYLAIFTAYYTHIYHLIILFFLGVILIGKTIVSNAIYALLGKVYRPGIGDSQIERFITIDYIMSNCGALLGTVFSGIFMYILNIHITLFLALGLSTFSLFCLIVFRNFLSKTGNIIDFKPLNYKQKMLSTITISVLVILATLCLISIKNIYPILIACVFFSFIFLILQFLTGDKITQSRLIFIIIVLIQLSAYYFFYHQSFNLVNIYIRKVIPNITFLGFTIRPYFYTVFNHFWVILMGILLLFLHKKLEQKNHRPSVFAQFSVAMLLSLGSFLVLYISTTFISQEGFLSLWWIFSFFTLQSTAEIIIAYISISLFIKLMPVRLSAFGLGLRTTILTLPALIFSAPMQMDAFNLTGSNAQFYFNTQFYLLVIIGLCLYLPLILIQPAIKWFYLKKTPMMGQDQEIGKQI